MNTEWERFFKEVEELKEENTEQKQLIEQLRQKLEAYEPKEGLSKNCIIPAKLIIEWNDQKEEQKQLIKELVEGLEYAVKKMPSTSENLKLNKTKLEELLTKAKAHV